MKILLKLLSTILVLFIFSCDGEKNSELSSENEVSVSKDSTDTPVQKTENEEVDKTSELNTITESQKLTGKVILSENNIGGLKLPFPKKEVLQELKTIFNNCSVTKEVGMQDGPDFPLYTIKCDEKRIAFMSMNYEDTLSLDDIYIQDSIIADEYGLKVGDEISKIHEIRDTGKIAFDPYHFHMYYSYPNSKIHYELKGELSTPETDITPDIVIEEKDIKNWKIKNIIWR